MRVRLLLFGALREIAGTSSRDVDLKDGATAADVWQALSAEFQGLQRYERAVAMAINREYGDPAQVLRDGDELAILPPVSGGSGATQVPELPLETPHARLQLERINSLAIVEHLKRGEDGAVTVFDGIVRNNSRGRKTSYLVYEAYAAMAIAELEKLATEAQQKFGVRDVRIIHRLGRMEIGESSVLIVVASAHRAQAFDACHWAIDTLKAKVPIWKKEFFADGAVWADGEPFPADIKTVEPGPG